MALDYVRRTAGFGLVVTLRELALRAVADEVGEKAASYRQREGLEPALIPERVMVCMSSAVHAPRVIRTDPGSPADWARNGMRCTWRPRRSGRAGFDGKIPKPCARTSHWPRASAQRWCVSVLTGRPMA